jgi:histidine triad (HIT) family protein
MLSRPVPDAWNPPGRVLSPMTDDFYCDEVLSGRTPVRVVHETEHTLAYHHTRPHWPVHIVVIPKVHVPSLTDLGEAGARLLPELLEAVRAVAAQVEQEHGAARVLTNLGAYQDSKHLHFHVNSGPEGPQGPASESCPA